VAIPLNKHIHDDDVISILENRLDLIIIQLKELKILFHVMRGELMNRIKDAL
jgi:hypothetical protein